MQSVAECEKWGHLVTVKYGEESWKWFSCALNILVLICGGS